MTPGFLEFLETGICRTKYPAYTSQKSSWRILLRLLNKAEEGFKIEACFCPKRTDFPDFSFITNCLENEIQKRGLNLGMETLSYDRLLLYSKDLDSLSLVLYLENGLFASSPHKVDTLIKLLSGEEIRILEKSLVTDSESVKEFFVEMNEALDRYLVCWLCFRHRLKYSIYLTFLYRIGVLLNNYVEEIEKAIPNCFLGMYLLYREEASCDEMLLKYAVEYHPYSTDVVEFYHPEIEPKKLYFGMELEFLFHQKENLSLCPRKRLSIQKAICRMEQRRVAIATQDSTVDGEVKVIPLEHEEAIAFVDSYQDFFRNIKTGIDVGFHIHLSKSAFQSQRAMSLFVVLINELALDPQTARLFGGKSSYAKVEKKDLADIEEKMSKGYHFPRQEAVNIQNAYTVEVRAFRATNDTHLVKRRINILNKAVKYVNTTQNLDYQEFKKKVL
jgi:hypothetical protein